MDARLGTDTLAARKLFSEYDTFWLAAIAWVVWVCCFVFRIGASPEFGPPAQAYLIPIFFSVTGAVIALRWFRRAQLKAIAGILLGTISASFFVLLLFAVWALA